MKKLVHFGKVFRMFALFLCCCFLFGFGCGNTGKDRGAAPSSGENATKNPKEPTKGEIPSPENRQDLSEEVANAKEEENNTVQPEVTVIKDIVPDVEFEFLENYKERTLPSVYEQEGDGAKEYYCNALLNAQNQIEYYTYSRDEDGCHFFKYTLIEKEEGGDGEMAASGQADAKVSVYWEREALPWCEGFGKEIWDGGDGFKIFTGEDGNDYAWYLGKDEKAHLVRRVKTTSDKVDGSGKPQGGQNMDSYEEITGLDWGYTNFIEPAVLANGQIVSADLGRECSIYDPEDGSLIKRFPCGFYWGLCVKGNQIYIGDKTGTCVQHYDAGQQEFAPILEAGFDSTIRVAISGDDVYVCNMRGIYRAKASGGQFQKVLDAGTYHFAKDSGTLLKFFVIGDAFYVVYGEEGGNIKKYSPAGEDDVAMKFLKIYSLERDDVVLDMISEFQEMYPEVEIVYETGDGAEGSITVADQMRTLNARILAGDGPDVLLMDGLPMESYVSKGILADLSPVLGDLKEELSENILSAYTREDKIYMLPARFFVPFFVSCVGRERYATLKDLVEYSEEEGGVLHPGYRYVDYVELLYYNYPPKFIGENKTVDKEEIQEFLELLKRMCESEGAAPSEKGPTSYLKGWNMSVFSMMFAEEDLDFAFVNLGGIAALGVYPSALQMRGGQMTPNGDMFFPTTLFAINRLAGQPELAASFLRFAFSYNIQKRDGGGYPIHTAVLDEMAEFDMSDHTLSDSKITLQDSGKEDNAKMIAYVKTVHTPFMVDASVWDIIEDEAIRYLNGKRELAESVDAIADKLQLYLYEQ